MKRPRQHFLAVVVLCACSSLAVPSVGAQQPTPTLREFRLATFVDTASARAVDYFAFFKDLSAEETKTVEQFREDGEVTKRRLIVSDLIVYKSVLDNGSIAEYRDVKSVDGAPLAGREQRVQTLFARQSRAKSVRDELKRINLEGSRYDLDYTISGLTMSQGLPLQPWARALFTFQEAGAEHIDGRETVILSYRQVAPNSRFGFNLSLPSEMRAAAPLFRGWLWLEPGTGRLVREVREVTVLPAGASTPVVVQRFEFRYGSSRFDVLLPTRIVFSSLGHFSRGPDGMRAVMKYRLSFNYGEFRRFTATSDDTVLAEAETSDGRTLDEAAEASAARTTDPPTSEGPDSSADLGPEFGPDAPLGPPASTDDPGTVVRPDSTVAPRAPDTRSRRSGSVPKTLSTRLTVTAGLPASAALGIPVSPMPVSGPSSAGSPAVPIPPPPLGPGEKPKFRPPPS